MKRVFRAGQTLIELLIVIAIVALLSASSLAFIVAPAKEAKRAELELSLQGGFASLGPRLSKDFHQATEVEERENPAGYLLKSAAAEPVLYYVDSMGTLRRHQGDYAVLRSDGASDAFAEVEAGASRVVPQVTRFDFEELDNDFWRVSVASGASTVGGDVVILRDYDIALGLYAKEAAK